LKYDVLLVNDDGYHSEGVKTIRRILKRNGYKVLTVTPDRNMSGSSHSLTFTRPLRIVKLKKDFYYIEDGTPADCVHLGFHVLLKRKTPKILVSGINTGPNLGDDIFYSGTVGAAREGTLLGIKSIALSPASSKNPNFKEISYMALDIIKKIIERGLPDKTFLNISFPNLPRTEIKGIKITKQGRGVYEEEIKEYISPSGEKYYWIGGKENLSAECDENSDYTAVKNGYISITPIKTDLTAYSEMDKVKKLILD
jgi:5'-nucleotidase